MTQWKPSEGFHLPEDSWICTTCPTECMAEYDEDEKPTCPNCNGDTVLKK